MVAQFTWGDGVGQIPFSELRVVGKFSPDGEDVVITEEDFDIDDNDGNGVFNVGDSITVFEPSNLFTPNSTPGTYVFALETDVFVPSVEDGEALRVVGYVPVDLPEIPQIEITVADAADVVAFGAHDVFTVTYASAAGPIFPVEALTAGALVGGEYPLTLQPARLDVDVNGDGQFGPGDAVTFEDSDVQYEDLSPEMVGNFGNLLYVDLRAEYAYNTAGYIAFGDVEVE